MKSLRDSLDHNPVELRFGTSGRRGKVQDLSQLEIYINLSGELEFLLGLPLDEGGIRPGEIVYIGYDLRPSSLSVVGMPRRGAIVQAVVAAVENSGLRVVNLGNVPTPTLAMVSWAARAASIMVTGSHIPFDRNGYKVNTSTGELLKSHEGSIGLAVSRIREQLYRQDAESSRFDAQGMLRDEVKLPVENGDLAEQYIDRYAQVFGRHALRGFTLLFYEHSTVGRDLIPKVFRSLGARVITRGRSDEFVPVDTESVQPEMIYLMQSIADDVMQQGERIDAVVSADGDADRPLIMAVDGESLRFIPGDRLGMLAAEFLRPDAIVVPISTNDGIDQAPWGNVLCAKTKIGSPYVIEGMAQAKQKGAKRVCGWEPNGGFLLGTHFEVRGKVLNELPTRDAALPLIAALLLCKEREISINEAACSLPSRFGATALLRNFPREAGLELITRVSTINDRNGDGRLSPHLSDLLVPKVLDDIETVDYTDGVRVGSSKSEVVHLRPSGNADEFRIYAVADSSLSAERIAENASRCVLSYVTHTYSH